MYEQKGVHVLVVISPSLSMKSIHWEMFAVNVSEKNFRVQNFLYKDQTTCKMYCIAGNIGSPKKPNLYPLNFALHIKHVFRQVLTASCEDIAASLLRKDACFPTTQYMGVL